MEFDMKRFIRDICVFMISLLGGAYLYRLSKNGKTPLVRVLAFHNVANPIWFEAVLQLLKREYSVISPSDFRNGNFMKNKVNVLITFDDGYDSWVTECLPLLKKYGIQGIFFINSGLLDSAGKGEVLTEYMKSNLKLSPKVPLTWEGVRRLKEEGHTIGGHTVHHQSLASLPTHTMKAEILEDKISLESRLGSDILDFAYPFGTHTDYSMETEKAVRAAGYSFVYTAEPGFCDSVTSHIPRTLLEEGQPISQVRRWILGSYDLFTAIKVMVR